MKSEENLASPYQHSGPDNRSVVSAYFGVGEIERRLTHRGTLALWARVGAAVHHFFVNMSISQARLGKDRQTGQAMQAWILRNKSGRM